MVKELETIKEKSEINWLSDFTKESLKTSAETNIKPKLTIDGVGLDYAKEVVILSEPYKVEIPKEKAIGKDNKIWMIDLEYNGVAHQFICQSGSFRFQLGVLMEKLDYTPKDLIELPIKLWKQIGTVNTPTFKGKAEMYYISMI